MNQRQTTARAYSDAFLQPEPASRPTNTRAPYGEWYAERFRAGTEPDSGPSADQVARAAQPARAVESVEPTRPEARQTSDQSERPEEETGRQDHAADGDQAANTAANTAATDASAEPPSADAEPSLAPERIVLEPRGREVALSAGSERQLQKNSGELRMLEGNLAAGPGHMRIIGFTSCLNGDGKTTAALNAAYGLATAAAHRVLLVDANPDHPTIHRLFGAEPEPGLREVLAGQASIEDALHPTPHSGLDILPAGGGWYGLGANIPLSRMSAFIELVREGYDYVILDLPSLFKSSDVTRLAPVVDGLALVTACEQTKWELAQTAKDKIRSAGGTITGVVLNKRRYYIPATVYRWLSH